jgi:hypothetical protein
VQKRTCASFVFQTSSDSSLSVPLGDLDHLKILQQSLGITYMDKCCNNFVFVCKKFIFLLFSLSLILLLVHMWSPILPSLIFWNFVYLLIRLIILEVLKCGPHLQFLCAVWKFHKNPIKPRFICAASSTSLTDVSKWLCSFFKAMFPMVNDLWVSKLKKADVPCDSSWILNDSTRVVEVIN